MASRRAHLHARAPKSVTEWRCILEQVDVCVAARCGRGSAEFRVVEHHVRGLERVADG